MAAAATAHRHSPGRRADRLQLLPDLQALAHLCTCLQVHLLNLEDFDADTWAEQLGAARVVVLLSSTYGAGACPATAVKFMSWLKNGNSGAGGILAGMSCCLHPPFETQQD